MSWPRSPACWPRMPRGGETFAIQVIGRGGGPLAAKLTPLAAISVKKTGIETEGEQTCQD